eukprot:1465528-Prymnesium_polylepis.1
MLAGAPHPPGLRHALAWLLLHPVRRLGMSIRRAHDERDADAAGGGAAPAPPRVRCVRRPE